MWQSQWLRGPSAQPELLNLVAQPKPSSPCGHGWLSGAYAMGTLSYGEEEFKFKFGMLNLTTLRLD